MHVVHSKSFTLVELMVIVGIVALLATVAVPSYKRYVARASIVSEYNLVASLANKSVENQNIRGPFKGDFSTNIGANTSIYVQGDSYNGGWDVLPTNTYNSTNAPSDNCEGKAGIIVVQFSEEFGIVPVTSAFIAIWFVNQGDVISSYCTITINAVDSSYNDLAIKGCENTGGSIWATVNTPNLVSGFHDATCPK